MYWRRIWSAATNPEIWLWWNAEADRVTSATNRSRNLAQQDITNGSKGADVKRLARLKIANGYSGVINHKTLGGLLVAQRPASAAPACGRRLDAVVRRNQPYHPWA